MLVVQKKVVSLRGAIVMDMGIITVMDIAIVTGKTRKNKHLTFAFV